MICPGLDSYSSDCIEMRESTMRVGVWSSTWSSAASAHSISRMSAAFAAADFGLDRFFGYLRRQEARDLVKRIAHCPQRSRALDERTLTVEKYRLPLAGAAGLRAVAFLGGSYCATEITGS